MNECIEATLRNPIKVKATHKGRKMVKTNRVLIDYWDGHNWIINARNEREYRKTGYPEVMAFPLLDNDVIAFWNPLGEWHGLGNKRPDWVRYLNELDASVPGNYEPKRYE